MPRTQTPREKVKVRRLPKVGDELTIKVQVTKTGRNAGDTADTVTIRLPGFEYPVTALADYLLDE